MTANQLFIIILALAAARALLHFMPRLEVPHRKTITEYLDSIVVAGFTALFLINFVVRSFYIPSGSMEQTLQINDYILVNEMVYHVYNPSRGDIIVFKPPPAAGAEGKDYIKRVVAVEGDTIEVKNDVVYINDKPTHEPYKHVEASLGQSKDYPRTVIPPEHVFVMGDNRHNSQDGRYWGPLPRRNIIGKAFLIFFPPRRIRMLE